MAAVLSGSACRLGALLAALLSPQVRNRSPCLRPSQKANQVRPEAGDPSQLSWAWLQNSHCIFPCPCLGCADPRAGQLVLCCARSVLGRQEKCCVHSGASCKGLTRASCGNRAPLPGWEQPGFAAMSTGRSSGTCRGSGQLVFVGARGCAPKATHGRGEGSDTELEEGR